MGSQLENTEMLRGMDNAYPSLQQRLQRQQLATQYSQKLYEDSQLWRRDQALYRKMAGESAYNWIDAAPDFGSSRFDKYATLQREAEDPTNLRAEQQKWYGKLGNDLLKAGALTVSTAINTANAAVGAAVALFSPQSWKEYMVNSDVTKAMIEFENLIEEILPNYRSYAEQDQFWLKNAFSPSGAANFWFDDVLKNFGFSYGSMAAARLVTLGTKGIAHGIGRVGSSVLKTSAKSTRGTINQLYHKLGTKSFQDEIAKIIADNALSKAEKDVLINKITRRQLFGTFYDRLVGSGVGALGEAQYEGARQMYDFAEKNKTLFNEFLESNLEFAQTMYQKNKPTNADGTPMSFDDYYNVLKTQGEQKIDDLALQAGQAVFFAELPLLLINNMTVWGRFFQGGFSSIPKTPSKSFIKKLFGNKPFNYSKDIKFDYDKLSDKLSNPRQRKLSKFKHSRTYQIGSSMFGEGVVEEMGQSFINAYHEYVKGSEMNDYMLKHYSTVLNREYNNTLVDTMNGLNYAWKQSYGNPDDWIEGFAGGMMGLGMPFLRRRQKTIITRDKNGKELSKWERIKRNIPLTLEWSGGIADWKEAQNEQKLIEDAVVSVNKHLQDPEFIERFHNKLRSLSYKNIKRVAINNDDRSTYKDADFADLMSVLSDFEITGAFGWLEEQVNTLSTSIDEDTFNQLQEEGKIDANVSFEDFSKVYEKEVTTLKNTVKDYANKKAQIQELFGNALSEDLTTTLTNMLMYTSHKEQRVKQMYEEVYDVLSQSDTYKDLKFYNNEIDIAKQLMSIINYDELNKKLNTQINSNVSDEQKEEIYKKLTTEFINELKQKAELGLMQFKEATDLAKKIIDIIRNTFEVIHLTDEFSMYVQNPELVQAIKNTVQKIIENKNKPKTEETSKSSRPVTEEQKHDIQTDAYIDVFDKIEKDLQKDSQVPDDLRQTLQNLLDEVRSKDDIENVVTTMNSILQDVVNNYDQSSMSYKKAEQFLRNLKKAVIAKYSSTYNDTSGTFERLKKSAQNFTDFMSKNPTKQMRDSDKLASNIKMTDRGYRYDILDNGNVYCFVEIDFISDNITFNLLDSQARTVTIPISDRAVWDKPDSILFSTNAKYLRKEGDFKGNDNTNLVFFDDQMKTNLINILVEQGSSVEDATNAIQQVITVFDNTVNQEGYKAQVYFTKNRIDNWTKAANETTDEAQQHIYENYIKLFQAVLDAINDYNHQPLSNTVSTPVEDVATEQVETPAETPAEESQPTPTEESTPQQTEDNQVLSDLEEAELQKTINSQANKGLSGSPLMEVTEWAFYDESGNFISDHHDLSFIEKLQTGLRSKDPNVRLRCQLWLQLHELAKNNGIYKLQNERRIPTDNIVKFKPNKITVFDNDVDIIEIYTELDGMTQLCGYITQYNKQTFDDIVASGLNDAGYYNLRGKFNGRPIRGGVNNRKAENGKSLTDEDLNDQIIDQLKRKNGKSCFVCFRTSKNVYFYGGTPKGLNAKDVFEQMSQQCEPGVLWFFTHRDGQITSTFNISDYEMSKVPLKPFKANDSVLEEIAGMLSDYCTSIGEYNAKAALNTVLRNCIVFQMPRRKQVNVNGTKQWVDDPDDIVTCTLQTSVKQKDAFDITYKGIKGTQERLEGYPSISFTSKQNWIDKLTQELKVVPSITPVSIGATTVSDENSNKEVWQTIQQYMDIARLIQDGYITMYQELIPFNTTYTFTLDENRKVEIPKQENKATPSTPQTAPSVEEVKVESDNALSIDPLYQALYDKHKDLFDSVLKDVFGVDNGNASLIQQYASDNNPDFLLNLNDMSIVEEIQEINKIHCGKNI